MRYNGVDLLTVHPAISIAKEIPPGMAPRELRTFAARDGERLAGADVQQAEYTARINIAGKTRAEAWQVRSLLAAWATSAGDSTAQLVPTHWPAVAYDAICVSMDDAEFTFGFGTLELKFALPCPYAYDLIPTTAAGSTSAAVQIDGSAPARPVITFTPTVAVEGLSLSLDGKTFLTIGGEIAAGTEVQVDTGTGALLIGGNHAEKRISYTKSTMMPDFSPGAHTLAANKAGAIKARWHNRWR